MTPEILKWLDEVVKPQTVRSGVRRVAEIGALNVNGSARDVLQAGVAEWIGIDLQAGACVDVVADAGAWLWVHEGEPFDMIVACECYEHDPRWWNTHEAARARLRAAGLYVVTTPTLGFPYHAFPRDYWRFTEDAYRDVIFAGMEVLDVQTLAGPCVVGLARGVNDGNT